MENKPLLPTSTRAYALFIEELDSQVTFAKQALRCAAAGSADDVNELKRIFHMIKGGAGFFGLTQVAEFASQIEGRLKQPLATVLAQCDELNRLVLEFETLKDQIGKVSSGTE